MKRVVWFLILLAVAFLAWKYYPEIEKRARERTSTRMVPAEPEAPSPDTTPRAAAATRPAPSPPPSSLPAEKFDSQTGQGHPLPQFKPIEMLVGNWRAIPPSAFPRQITVKVPVELRLSAGTARVEAGAKVVALSAHEGMLTVAPAVDSPALGHVPLEQTNFKEALTEVYEKFKQLKRDEVPAARRQAQQEKERIPSSSAALLPELLEPPGADPPPAALARVGSRPAQSPDRTVPAMIASINERQRNALRGRRESEPKLAEITSWGRIRYHEVEGEPYWVCGVRYTARTIFGEFPAEALALMRQGKVIKWVYAGTGEPVF